jgi:hypothetical protein
MHDEYVDDKDSYLDRFRNHVTGVSQTIDPRLDLLGYRWENVGTKEQPRAKLQFNGDGVDGSNTVFQDFILV